ncbi:MAG: carbohydrate kinase family protein [Chloroflexi bacterium]|nr:carbohydrate kinase family protein [Chloroflexota bacterium]
MSKIEVVGLGALNMDYLYRVERILEDGETILKESRLFPGGSAANTLYGLARLGVSTGFVGVVGNDDDGKALIKDFQQVGVDTSQIRVKAGAKTGSVLCISDSSDKRSLYVSPGANNLLTDDDISLTYVNQAKLLHISSFADDRQFKVLLELAERLSTTASFAPGALYTNRGLEALAPILRRTYVLFLNRQEIEQLTGQDIGTGAETCLKRGCRVVAVTLGKGTRLKMGNRTTTAVAYIKDARNEYVIEPGNDATPVVDTTGAGDAFAAGFLYGLLKEKGLEECGRLGNMVAQFSIREVGARAGLPTLDELAQRYRALYGQDL